MDNSRKLVQARESLLAIMIILSAIFVEVAYTSGPVWYWFLLLNIPVIILLAAKPRSREKRVANNLKKVKQLQWLQ